jgi:dienelactone hydrolase
MKLRLGVGLILSAFVAIADAAHSEHELIALAHLFDYDAHQTLDIHDKTLKEFGCGVIHDITYASPSGGPISAYLIVPKGNGPFAAIVFGHWGNGTRGEFIPEAKAYACAGVVSLLPDYRWERPRPWYSGIDDFAHPDLDRKTRINTVIEMRRAIDLLLTRGDVDPNRVAYVGHSFGAQWGAILTAVDRRLKAAVLMAGAAEEADMLLRSDNPRLADLRASLPTGQLDTYLNTLADLDAINYIRFAQPVPLLLQFANFEQYFDRASMDRYVAAATEPKTVLFYDSAHDLNDSQALKDRSDWLAKRLGFSVGRAIRPRRFAVLLCRGPVGTSCAGVSRMRLTLPSLDTAS